jgi:hypothetical protein
MQCTFVEGLMPSLCRKEDLRIDLVGLVSGELDRFGDGGGALRRIVQAGQNLDFVQWRARSGGEGQGVGEAVEEGAGDDDEVVLVGRVRGNGDGPEASADEGEGVREGRGRLMGTWDVEVWHDDVEIARAIIEFEEWVRVP